MHDLMFLIISSFLKIGMFLKGRLAATESANEQTNKKTELEKKRNKERQTDFVNITSKVGVSLQNPVKLYRLIQRVRNILSIKRPN